MPLNVIVLAAGQGKRMHSALPKVLHRLGGRPLLAHVLGAAQALAAERTLVVYGHGGEQVKAAFAGTPVHWVEQREQRGTGHAVMQALAQTAPGAEILVLNGDVPLVRPESLRRLADAARSGLALLTIELSDPARYGRVLRDAAGNVHRIVEAKDASAEELAIGEIFTGFLAAPREKLAAWLERVDDRNAQGEYYLTDIVRHAVADAERVVAIRAADAWEVAGVNSKRELAELERALQKRLAHRLLEAGVSLADPARVDVRGELACGRDVEIDVNCVFEGEVRLGDRVKIGPNCVLRNTSVADDTEVHAYSLLDDARVGARCRIGPFARLRPGAELAEEVHVGNFVEIKASRLGAGAKANHLAYVGDAEVGRRVNIGAGTITCNYDGAAKHRTVIEDDCFIGSDATLVAPVTIARGSYIGAGSTISKNTPPNQLSIARARQVSVPAWKPKKRD